MLAFRYFLPTRRLFLLNYDGYGQSGTPRIPRYFFTFFFTKLLNACGLIYYTSTTLRISSYRHHHLSLRIFGVKLYYMLRYGLKIVPGLTLWLLDERRMSSGLALAAAIGTDVEGLEPKSLAEAKRRPGWLRWKEAMDEEMKALEAYKTWELDDLSSGANLVGCRWVYALKIDATGHIIHYKACAGILSDPRN